MIASFLFLLLSIEQTYLVVPIPLESISICSDPEKNDSWLISLSLAIHLKTELLNGSIIMSSLSFNEHCSSDNVLESISYELTYDLPKLVWLRFT